MAGGGSTLISINNEIIRPIRNSGNGEIIHSFVRVEAAEAEEEDGGEESARPDCLAPSNNGLAPRGPYGMGSHKDSRNGPNSSAFPE